MRNPVSTTGDAPIRNPPFDKLMALSNVEGQSPIRNRDWRLDALALGAILALLIVLTGHALFSATRVLGDRWGDGATQFFPWRVFGYQEWRTTGLPLWNPYVLLGMPFVANLQSSMFYPTGALFFALPIPIACNWAILVNLFLSASFTYILSRALKLSRPASCLAALTYTLSANHVFRVYQGHWSMIEALPWLPLLALCAEMIVSRRRWPYVALGAVAVAMMIFAGQPQLLFYACIFAGIYFVFRLVAFGDGPRAWRERLKAIGMFAAIFPLGAALGAVQLVPALELVSYSSRPERVTLEWAGSYSLPLENMATLVAPHVMGPALKNGSETLPYWGRWNFWETGFYMGLVSLVLCLAGIIGGERRRWWPFAIPGAFFLFLALGLNAPLFKSLYEYVPGFNLFRVPARAITLLALSVGVIAGLGLDVVLSGDARRRRRLKWTVIVVAALVLGAALAVQTVRSPAPSPWTRFVSAIAEKAPRYGLPEGSRPDDQFMQRSWSALRTDLLRSAVLAVIAGVLVLVPGHGRRIRLAAAVSLVFLAAADFYTFDRPFMDTFDSNDRIWNAELIAEFQQRGRQHPFRVSNRTDWYKYACQPMMYRISSLEGVEPNVPARFHDFFWRTQNTLAEKQQTNYQARVLSRLFDLVNLQYLVERGADGPQGEKTFRVYTSPGALPRAFVLHKYFVATGRDEQRRRLNKWDHDDAVMLEEAPETPPAPAAGEEPVPVFERYDPRGAEIRVNLKSAGLLVLSDLYYPGWVAKVDGRKTKIYRADYLLRAVVVPAGEHTVEFEYVCPAFGWGAAISVTGGGVVVGYAYYVLWQLLMARRRKRGLGPRLYRGLGPIAPMRPLSSR